MEGHPNTIIPPFPGLPTEMVLKILGNLNDQSLLSCRLVSKGWCEVTSNILQSRSTVAVRLWCCPPHHWTECSLCSFINFFKKSRESRHTFPFANYMLMGSEQDIFSCPQLEDFFALSKPTRSGSSLMIKRLGIRTEVYQSTANILKRLILKGTPHMSELHLDFPNISPFGNLGQIKVNRIETQTGDNSTFEKHSSLKVLQLSHCTGAAAVELVRTILEEAPNIQRIEGTSAYNSGRSCYYVQHPDTLQVLVATKKLHLINNYWLTLNKDIAISGLLVQEKLSGFQPKVLHLCRLHSTRSAPNLEQAKTSLRGVFWAVKDSVEELQTDDCLGLLDKLNFPRFSKLRLLKWDLHEERDTILPAGIRNLDVFPKLEKIRFSVWGLIGDNSFLPPLSQIPEIPSVQSLQVLSANTFTKEFLDTMSVMCPNLQTLEISYFSEHCPEFGRVGPLIWEKMGQLHTIVVGSVVHMEMLEAWFTGFPLATVRQLSAVTPKDRPKVQDVEHLRFNPSILQLKELKKLLIKYDEHYIRGSRDLSLSFKYAFNLMPGLIVNVSSN